MQVNRRLSKKMREEPVSIDKAFFKCCKTVTIAIISGYKLYACLFHYLKWLNWIKPAFKSIGNENNKTLFFCWWYQMTFILTILLIFFVQWMHAVLDMCVVYFDQQMHACTCVYMVRNNEKRLKIIKKVEKSTFLIIFKCFSLFSTM